MQPCPTYLMQGLMCQQLRLNLTKWLHRWLWGQLLIRASSTPGKIPLMFSLLDNRIHWWQLGWDSLTALPLETVQDKLETVQDKLETVQDKLETVQDKLETVQDKLGTVQDTVQDKLGNAQEKLENTQ